MVLITNVYLIRAIIFALSKVKDAILLPTKAIGMWCYNNNYYMCTYRAFVCTFFLPDILEYGCFKLFENEGDVLR